MDNTFKFAMTVAYSGDAAAFETLLDEQPNLVRARSGVSHPNLLQFVAVEGGLGKIPDPHRFALLLIERGSPLNEALVAAASVDCRSVVEVILAAGASIEAGEPWTPLEEALYWAHRDLAHFLRVEHAAALRSLRASAAYGDRPAIEACFEGPVLRSEAGAVVFPWGTVSSEPQAVLDQALVIAVKNGQRLAAELLIDRGANPNAFPPGIHERASPLHMAACNNHAALAHWLIAAGADCSATDPEHRATPAQWAAHAGFRELAASLASAERS